MDCKQCRRTFTHVGTAPHCAFVLYPSWVNTPAEFEKTRLIPLCGVGHDLGEQVRQPFILCPAISGAHNDCH